jgi:hypothetical protein
MGCLGAYEYDEFNVEKRNLGSAKRCDYNCGGFALGLYNWYLPYPQEMRSEISMMFGDWKCSYQKTMKIMVNYMVDTLPVRVIKSLKHLDEETEYCVAFRLSKGDFHYVKRYKQGVWYHKMGGSYRIQRMEEEEVFSKRGWIGGRYNSKIVLLAVKKRQFRG